MVDRANRPSALSPSVTGPQPTVDSDGKKVTATLPTGDSVEVYLYGATVTSWKNKGKEHLWVSEGAKFDGSKAIRGGVPVVFPVRTTPFIGHLRPRCVLTRTELWPCTKGPRNLRSSSAWLRPYLKLGVPWQVIHRIRSSRQGR